MELITLGTGSALHDAKRIDTSSLVITKRRKILVDCGAGTSLRLSQAGFTSSDIDAIFITHFHLDHCLELPALLFSRILSGNLEMPEVYGPVGLQGHCSIVFEKLYPYIYWSMQKREREFHLPTHEVSDGTFLEEEGMKVSCMTVKHPIPTLAFRFDTPEGSIGFSGDTEPYEPLADFCKDVDMFVHECFWPDRFGPAKLHTIPSELGPIAQRSEAKHLVLNHLNPKVNGYEQEMIESIAKHFSGKITVGEDLMRIFV